MYNWSSLAEVLKYENEIRQNNVSVVARGKNGFLSEYKKYKTANIMKKQIVPGEKLTWEQKRNAFLARSVPQYKNNPTYRRWLSLIAWAFNQPKLH